ncbi:MAG: TonB-dependent receptor [bacterium]
MTRIFIVLFCATTSIYSAEFGVIKGFVSDAKNGERLAYADVVLKNTTMGTSTDEKGYYYISRIPEGNYTIVFSYLGYETVEKEIEIKAGQVFTLNIELKQSAIEMPEVVVSAERERFDKSVEVSHITFTQREIRSVPGLFESDLIKTLQLMPGAIGMHDLSSKLYVRGGSPDENLVLLDGITIYNPATHLFGLFSTFQPDAVNEAELYAGGFPAKYGDRLSAVLDVTTKEGNSKKYEGSISIGLITSKLLVECPIPKGSFLFSGRRTYFDALIWGYSHIFNKDVELPYYFYDGVAKMNYNHSSENRFTFTGFGGADVISFSEGEPPSEKVDLVWGNRGISGRWRRVFTPKLYGEILGVWSNFFTDLSYIDYYDSTANMKLYENIKSLTGKCDFAYIHNEGHTFDFGLQEENLSVKQQWEVEEGIFGPPEQNSNLVAIYFQDKWQCIKPILYIQPGIRLIYYNQGNRFLYNPRIGLKYRFQENSALNLSAGKYNQFLITINSQESYFSIFDFWRPVDSIHHPPVGYHFICGIEKWLGEGTNFNIEVYYKKYYNLLIPREEDIFFSVPTESLRVGNGYATGFDIFIKKSFKDYFGWISYTFGYTRRSVGDISYFPRYDRRHNLNVVLGFIIPKSILFLKDGKLDLRWYLGSGLPYAEDIARYRHYYYSEFDTTGNYPDSWWEYIKGDRDAFRLPLSHRLDLHYEKEIKVFGLNGGWYLDIINLYARKNVLFYDYEYFDYNTGQEYDPPKKVGYSIPPIAIPIPSFGFNLRF